MRPLQAALLLLAAAFLCPSFTPAQTFTVLHTFQSSDGARPMAALTEDRAGNLYGTTAYGGLYDSGTVFKMARNGTFTLLHSFGATANDGADPFSPLLLDRYGNLYGTTVMGGANCEPGVTDFTGCGTVFRINPSGTESVLHNFGSSPGDGMNPFSGLIADPISNALYGTTWGGSNGSVAYQITPAGNESVLYTQTGPSLYGPLVQDASGDLWGTSGGGNSNPCQPSCGTVFRLHKTASGWIASTTYTFTGAADGANPWAGLVYDRLRHVFYGVTPYGGANGFGVLFRLDSTGTQLTVLHSFDYHTDGAHPTANLILDPLGDVYGVTPGGGSNNQGTAFMYTAWGQFMTLHTFTSSAGTPEGGLIFDWKTATLYGTTAAGGDAVCQCGVVYSIAP
jgi:uncharacterized repeat protein (TIGR03803 family)